MKINNMGIRAFHQKSKGKKVDFKYKGLNRHESQFSHSISPQLQNPRLSHPRSPVQARSTSCHNLRQSHLPPYLDMERITRSRSMKKTLDAKDYNNGVSAPPTAGHGIYPPSADAAFYRMKDSYESYETTDSDLLAALEAEKTLPAWAFSEYYDGMDDIEIRRECAENFRSAYIYGSVKDGCNNSMEQRTCIWPGGTLSWQGESSGIMWIGVHGKDSICVVTRSGDLDPRRLRGGLNQCLIQEVLSRFRRSVIVEMEDLADPSREIHEKRIEKPFGVVSVIPGAYKSRKGSVEYGETKAVEFLQEKVKSDTVFTVTETIQTAIAAFGHLFQKKFKDDEIEVTVMDPNNTVELPEEPNVEDLKIRQINEHLAAINKPGPPSKRKMEPRPNDSSSGSRRLRERQHIISAN